MSVAFCIPCLKLLIFFHSVSYVLEQCNCKDLWHYKCPYLDVAEIYPQCLYLCRVEKTLHINLNNHKSGFVQLCNKYLNKPHKTNKFYIFLNFHKFKQTVQIRNGPQQQKKKNPHSEVITSVRYWTPCPWCSK